MSRHHMIYRFLSPVYWRTQSSEVFKFSKARLVWRCMMYFQRLIKRILAIRDTSIVPAVCYAQCRTIINFLLENVIWEHALTAIPDNAFIAGQRLGKTPALCAASSPFEIEYNACTSCVVAHSNSTEVSQTTSVEQVLEPFISYCLGQASSSNSSSNETLSSISSQLSAASVISSIQVSLSQAGIQGLLSTVTWNSTVFITQTLSINNSPATPSKLFLFLSTAQQVIR